MYKSSSLGKLITYRIARVQAKLNAQVSALLKEHSDLTITQWRVLRILKDSGGESTLSEISVKATFDKSLLSRNIKSLSDQRLLKITRDSKDMRSQKLLLSAEGLKLYEKLAPLMERRQRFIMSSLTQEESEIIFGILEKIEKASESREYPD